MFHFSYRKLSESFRGAANCIGCHAFGVQYLFFVLLLQKLNYTLILGKPSSRLYDEFWFSHNCDAIIIETIYAISIQLVRLFLFLLFPLNEKFIYIHRAQEVNIVFVLCLLFFVATSWLCFRWKITIGQWKAIVIYIWWTRYIDDMIMNMGILCASICVLLLC